MACVQFYCKLWNPTNWKDSSLAVKLHMTCNNTTPSLQANPNLVATKWLLSETRRWKRKCQNSWQTCFAWLSMKLKALSSTMSSCITFSVERILKQAIGNFLMKLGFTKQWPRTLTKKPFSQRLTISANKQRKKNFSQKGNKILTRDRETIRTWKEKSAKWLASRQRIDLWFIGSTLCSVLNLNTFMLLLQGHVNV